MSVSFQNKYYNMSSI